MVEANFTCSLEQHQIGNSEDDMPGLIPFTPEIHEDNEIDEPEETTPEARSLTVTFSLDSMNVVIDVNFLHRLHNVWINALSTNIGSHMSKDLGQELKDADAAFRVKMSMNSIVLAIDKCFSETSKCPNGDGDAFKTHME